MKKIKTSKGKEFNATEQGMAKAIKSLKNVEQYLFLRVYMI